jgi:hypothetical protein
MIAKRVTNPYEDADAFISFTGRKGSSKSTSSSAFAEGVAEDIATLRNKNEDPEKFFNIDHVRSISEKGAIELLSSGVLKNENSVFLLDDTGTQWGARNFQSLINKYLNSILQICRVYRCVLIANFIMANHVDIQARQMTDFRAQMLYKNTRNEQALFKFFYVEQGENGKEYKKYLRWHGKRITSCVIGRPSVKFEIAYKKMRKENTDQFIEDAQVKLSEDMARRDGTAPDGRSRDYGTHPKIMEIREAVRKDPSLGEMNHTSIADELQTTRYWVGLALGRKKKTIGRNTK